VDIAWYLRRVRRMSAAEVVWRARAIAIQQAWRFRRPRSAPGAISFAGGLVDANLTVDPAARRRLIAAADAVCAGRWRVLGRDFDTSPADPDWHRDRLADLRFDPACYCFDVPYRDPKRVGNVKALWEPSRLHHVTLLAAAFRVSGDGRYARHAADHLRSWWRANPPLRGIHWLSGIELGMRLIAWTWSRRLLADWPDVAALFENNPDFALQIEEHERWLAALHSLGSSANNHLIAEAAGLFIATTAFGGSPDRARSDRARLARSILEREIAAQTFADGLNRELAFGYHGYVLGLFLLAAVEAEAAGRPMSDGYWAAMTRMADALAANLSATRAGELEAPRQGDGDDAVALLLDAPEAGPWSPLLELCGAVVGAPGWWPAPRGRSVLAALLAPRSAGRRSSAPRPRVRPDRFPEAGVTFLRNRTLACRIDHGPLGFLATSAHGHADALSFELWVNGQPVLVDPGTYCYQGDPLWRRYFRSTLAHNTLEIGGADQAVQAGTFLWSGNPRSWIVDEREVDDTGEIILAHDGYRRLSGAPVHHRSFRLDRRDGRLAVVDWVEAAMPVAVRLAFHLHPAVDVVLEGGTAHLRWREGRAALKLPALLSWSLHRGEENPPLGWYSPEFGEKTPATALVGAGLLDPGERLEATLRPDTAGSIVVETRSVEDRNIKELSA